MRIAFLVIEPEEYPADSPVRVAYPVVVAGHEYRPYRIGSQVDRDA
jgi:hypothetical protein